MGKFDLCSGSLYFGNMRIHELLLPLVGLAFLPCQGQRIIPIGSGIHQGQAVHDLEIHEDKLIIAGHYSRFNDHQRPNIQGWNGSEHFDMPGPFGSVLSSSVRALQLFEGDLIAGGREPTFNNIARWNGTEWSAMGSGLPDRVLGLLVMNGELLAYGDFDGILGWSGSAWNPIVDGSIGQIQCMASFQGQLYAGGTLAPYLFRSTGDQWEPFLGGLDGPVLSLLELGQHLYVGGEFTTAVEPTIDLPYLCRSNGNTYESLPNMRIDAPVTNLALGPNGELIASLNTDDPSSYLLTSSGQLEIGLPIVRKSILYNGKTYIAGSGYGRSFALIQSIGELRSGIDEAFLDINGVSAYFQPSGIMFTDEYRNRPGFEVFNEEGRSTIYGMYPCFSARSSDSIFTSTPWHLAIETTAGPNAIVADQEFFERYHQVWMVDRDQIVEHQLHFAEPGYSAPLAILTWPGNGNTTNGEPMRVAPFADINGNGIYEPETGDHPLIRGDRAIYYVLHDKAEFGAGINPVLDVHVMHYAFANTWDPHLSETIFTNIKYINRSSRNYTNVAAGCYTDWDIGNYRDDLAGCDTVLQLAYGYNRYPIDSSSSNSLGYGAAPPAQGLVLLTSPLNCHVTWQREGITFSDLDSPVQLYARMRGYFGTVGITDPNGVPTTLEYTGDPNNLGEWTGLLNADTGNEDIRVMATSFLPDLLAGDTLCMDLALVAARDTVNGHLGSVAMLKQRTAALRSWFQEQSIQCNGSFGIGTSTPTHGPEPPELKLFPNPCAHSFTVSIEGQQRPGAARILGLTGNVIRTIPWTTDPNHEVDVSSLENGMYLLELNMGGSVHSRRFVVNH